MAGARRAALLLPRPGSRAAAGGVGHHSLPSGVVSRPAGARVRFVHELAHPNSNGAGRQRQRPSVRSCVQPAARVRPRIRHRARLRRCRGLWRGPVQARGAAERSLRVARPRKTPASALRAGGRASRLLGCAAQVSPIQVYRRREMAARGGASIRHRSTGQHKQLARRPAAPSAPTPQAPPWIPFIFIANCFHFFSASTTPRKPARSAASSALDPCSPLPQAVCETPGARGRARLGPLVWRQGRVQPPPQPTCPLRGPQGGPPSPPLPRPAP